MEYEQAQQAAIAAAGNNYAAFAVVFRHKDAWAAGYHQEDRYLESYFSSPEIHICRIRRDQDFNPIPDGEWRVYKSPAVEIDYVQETGATGDMADLLRRLMEARRTSKPDSTDDET